MRKRRIGYAAWLLLAACLYFFENNTGTRIVLICSLLFPLIRPLRAAIFSPDEPAEKEAPETLNVKAFISRKQEDAGDVRKYVPGDPVRRIHWKLSAKKDELLVRETAAGQETAEEERRRISAGNVRTGKAGRHAAAGLASGIFACIALVLLIPEARRGAQELCNRLFAASEEVNSYAYSRFTVPEHQSVLLAAVLLICAAALYLATAAVLRSRLLVMCVMAAATLFQVYFGLSFPAWINIPLYGLLTLLLLKRPVDRRCLAVFCVLILLVSAAVALLLPGADAAMEEASEMVRDVLSGMAGRITGTAAEAPAGETETRHIHTRSLESGEKAADTEQEFRLVTVEEEQISRPHWMDWMKTVLLLLLTVGLVTLPFAPFLMLNARKRKAREIREAFASENAGEAVQAAFRQVILWLEATGHGAGNQLFRNWSSSLPEGLPEGYADRFTRCAEDYEEAVYSGHAIPEQKRLDALDLLKETETALWNAADRKQRFYLKYWMCLHE